MHLRESYNPHGAKHSPPGDIIGKSGGPHATGENPLELQISKVKFHLNEEFSILIIMIFNVDSNYVHPRFQFRVYMWVQVNISDKILEILR